MNPALKRSVSAEPPTERVRTTRSRTHGPIAPSDQPTKGTLMTIQVVTSSDIPPLDELELDVSIVEEGDAAAVLLLSTDNGCNTLAGGDC
jgi:FxLD family lantipeptide